MSLDTLNNGDSGLAARTKINAAIDAINAGGGVSTPNRCFIETDGNDSTGDGSMSAPFATLAEAHAAGFRCFVFGAGTFSVGTITSYDGLTFIGQGAGKTLLQGTNYLVFTGAANHTWWMQHLAVSGMGGGGTSLTVRGVGLHILSHGFSIGYSTGSKNCALVLAGDITVHGPVNSDGTSNVGGDPDVPGPSYEAGNVTLEGSIMILGSVSLNGSADYGGGVYYGNAGILRVGSGCSISGNVSCVGGAGGARTGGNGGAVYLSPGSHIDGNVSVDGGTSDIQGGNSGTVHLRPGTRIAGDVGINGGYGMYGYGSDGTLFCECAQVGGYVASVGSGFGSTVKMSMINGDCIIDSALAVPSFSGAPTNLGVTNGFITAAA